MKKEEIIALVESVADESQFSKELNDMIISYIKYSWEAGFAEGLRSGVALISQTQGLLNKKKEVV
uniref:Uncharacterized protein n=1 Tax=viral metagenome TaxID=1070528 RepID=A0A6M3IHR7_9ZZZZ